MAESSLMAEHRAAHRSRWSMIEPPLLSAFNKELRIVLLGSEAAVKASCGNIIFRRQVFSESPPSPHLSERHDGMVLKRRLVIINTPDLFSPAVSGKERDLRRFFQLSCPEPHALLLVLKSGTFTEQDRDAFQLITTVFGTGVFEHVIVVFMHEMQYVSITDTDSRSEKLLLEISKRPPYHLQRNGDQSKVQNLLEIIEEMVEENRGHELKIGFLCTENSVRIVLIGKTGVGKSATGNTILGRKAFESRASMKSTTRMCQRVSGIACGRPVTVVDTPGLFDTSFSDEVIQQEIIRCIELLAPGPHVFLLLISIGPFTQEERETLELIKMTFGQKAESYTMVLFTKGDNLDDSIEDYIEDGDSYVQQLIHDCGGRFHVFNNKQKDPGQVVSLLKKIDKMMLENKSSFYNDKMFLEAERALRLAQINREKEEEVTQGTDTLKAKHESEIKQYKEKLEEEHKKQSRWKKFTLFIKGKRKVETSENTSEDFESGEENVEKVKHTVTDQQTSEDSPKISEDEKNSEKELSQHYKKMEDCRQSWAEAMRKSNENTNIHSAEVKRIEARNAAPNIDNFKKNHGKRCVLQ